MPLGFIHVVAGVRIFFLFKTVSLYGQTTFYLSIHLLMDTWVASTFWLLGIMLLWTWVYNPLYFGLVTDHCQNDHSQTPYFYDTPRPLTGCTFPLPYECWDAGSRWGFPWLL